MRRFFPKSRVSFDNDGGLLLNAGHLETLGLFYCKKKVCGSSKSERNI